MTKPTKAISEFMSIFEWLAPWLEQLQSLGEPDDYRALVDEMGDPLTFRRTLTRLNSHITLAAQHCRNLRDLLDEKRELPSELHEANRVVLDKLAEVRAIVGLVALGFSNILFNGSPDLAARRSGVPYLIEVTRLGRSVGKRSNVWDKHTVGSGFPIGEMYSGGNAEAAISEALYREVEGKYRQLKGRGSDRSVVWVSLGRDYLTAGMYELPGIGLLSGTRRMPGAALQSAWHDLTASEGCRALSHVVLSLGRDQQDLVVPELNP